MSESPSLADLVVVPFDPTAGDVVYHRDPTTGEVRTNIAQRVEYHSRTGFDWGLSGGGAADFALNILDRFLPPDAGNRPTVPCRDGHRVSASAWDLHEAFTREFVAEFAPTGGVLSGDAIRVWLHGHGALVEE